MYLLVLLFPFLNLVISCVFGRFLGRYTKWFIVLNMFLCVFISFFIFYEVGLSKYFCLINLGS
jgi:NADH:ubiquinone oxidoreductase subunit 5 (subunit L)/multisubunit Na+/H+ antiporter MnhA subunit